MTIVARYWVRCATCRAWLNHGGGHPSPGEARREAQAQGWTVQAPADPKQRDVVYTCPNCTPKETS